MRNKKNIIMVVMCIAVFVMAVGYAVFSTNLNIGATGNINTTWGISITNITSSITGTAVNITDPTYTGVNATFNAGLKKPGDKMTYSITVSNSGNIDALIIDVLINTSGAGEVIYSVENLNKNHKLAKGSTFTFNLITEFDSSATYIPTLSSKQINISIVVLQDDGSTPTPIAPEITDTTTQYGIMYVANGGVGTMQGTVCTVGTPCTLATNTFTRNGYEFKGWSTTPTGTVEYTDGQSVTDITTSGKTQVLYAVWEQNAVLLVDKIMSDNTSYADNVASPYVTNSTGIDFSKGSATVSSYNEVHGTTTQNIKFSETTSYCFGDNYNYNASTGSYLLMATKCGTWSSMSSDYETYQYTCLAPSTMQCTKLYEMTDYVSATEGTGYVHTVTANATDDNGKGLYYTSTNTEGNKTTYYFRGNVENNYVKFAGYDWRIVRINEDGSVRLVTDSVVDYSAFNSTSGDNAYVGYMYGQASAAYYGTQCLYLTPGSDNVVGDAGMTESECDANGGVYLSGDPYSFTHANVADSTIKTYLDTWYTNNLSSYSSYLADAGFCNDRSVATGSGLWHSNDTALGYGTEVTYYGPYNRLNITKQPQYKCPLDNDLFTLNSSAKGNKSLTKAIGLLSSDEVVYAGGVLSMTTNITYYLYSGTPYWTMSPNSLPISLTGLYEGYSNYVFGTGYIYSTYSTTAYGVRPVINLKSTVNLSDELPEGCTEQNGTEACPYIIKTN